MPTPFPTPADSPLAGFPSSRSRELKCFVCFAFSESETGPKRSPSSSMAWMRTVPRASGAVDDSHESLPARVVRGGHERYGVGRHRRLTIARHDMRRLPEHPRIVSDFRVTGRRPQEGDFRIGEVRLDGRAAAVRVSGHDRPPVAEGRCKVRGHRGSDGSRLLSGSCPAGLIPCKRLGEAVVADAVLRDHAEPPCLVLAAVRRPSTNPGCPGRSAERRDPLHIGRAPHAPRPVDHRQGPEGS